MKALNGKGDLPFEELMHFKVFMDMFLTADMARGVQAIYYSIIPAVKRILNINIAQKVDSLCLSFKQIKQLVNTHTDQLKTPYRLLLRNRKLGSENFLESSKNSMSSNSNEAYIMFFEVLLPKKILFN